MRPTRFLAAIVFAIALNNYPLSHVSSLLFTPGVGPASRVSSDGACFAADAATMAATPSAASPSAATQPVLIQSAHGPETQAQHDARMAWWRDAKFGMFIHWGLYCIPADGEWHMRAHQEPLAEYQKLAAQFNPTKFNADEWASIAQDAGMKYMTLTTKHHDGFAMFHSSTSPYNVYDATPFKRDPLKELSLACPKHDIRLCTYYSVIADWGHPGGGAGCPKWDKAQVGDLDDYINKVSVPQVRELLTNYGPIGVIWFDSDGAQPKTLEQAQRYLPVLKLQPNIIVDPRLHGVPGDFDTAEGHIPLEAPAGDWELCDRVNGSWGYTHSPARPLDMLLHMLIEAWSKGGNVLLNVGPTPEGIIPPDSVERLKQIGAWLKINGESIYGSTRGPFDYLPWGWTTRKGDMLYCHVFNWPADGALKLPMTTPVDSAWLLADSTQKIAAQTTGDETILTLPAKAPDPIASVIAVKLNGDVPPTHSLLVGGTITASDNQRSAPSLLQPTGGNWRIAGSTATLEVNLPATKTFSVLRLTTPYTSTSKILLEVKDGDGWKTAFSLEPKKGNEWVETFPPVTGQTVRLTLTASKPGMRVGVFELFPPL